MREVVGVDVKGYAWVQDRQMAKITCDTWYLFRSAQVKVLHALFGATEGCTEEVGERWALEVYAGTSIWEQVYGNGRSLFVINQ